MINPHSNKILVGDGVGHKIECAGIYARGAVCTRVECKVRLDPKIHPIRIRGRGDNKVVPHAVWGRSRTRTGDKLAVARAIRRRCNGAGDAKALSQAFIVGKEECVLLDDRPTGGGAELVPLEGRHYQIARRVLQTVEEITGVELAVPQKFIGGAMNRVRAGARSRVDYSTGSLAIIGWGIARHHGKLLDRIHSENASLDAARGAGSLVVDAHAIQPIIILLRTIAADGDVDAQAAVRTVVIDRKRFLRTHLRNTWF